MPANHWWFEQMQRDMTNEQLTAAIRDKARESGITELELMNWLVEMESVAPGTQTVGAAVTLHSQFMFSLLRSWASAASAIISRREALILAAKKNRNAKA